MKASEITDGVVEAILSGKQDFVRINYANGDMVGHTGDFNATRVACEVVDIQIGRLIKAVKKANGMLLITADHGNADEMYERNKKGEVVENSDGSIKPRTSHSLNKVPFIVYDPQGASYVSFSDDDKAGLGNIASTCINLLGYKAPEDFAPSLITLK